MTKVYGLICLLGILLLGMGSLKLWPEVYGHSGYLVASVVTAATIVSFGGVFIESHRPLPPVRRKGDRVRAAYFPGGDPVPQAERYVGSILLWEAVARCDRGKYRGVWMMRLCDVPESVTVPLTDLLIQERRRRNGGGFF